MKVRELIARLQEVAWQDAEVRVWDVEADDYVPVIGVFHGEPGHTDVELQTGETS